MISSRRSEANLPVSISPAWLRTISTNRTSLRRPGPKAIAALTGSGFAILLLDGHGAWRAFTNCTVPRFDSFHFGASSGPSVAGFNDIFPWAAAAGFDQITAFQVEHLSRACPTHLHHPPPGVCTGEESHLTAQFLLRI